MPDESDNLGKDREGQQETVRGEDIVIADMNVEGMPWYREEKTGGRKDSRPGDQLTRKETFYVILGAMKAALLIAVVISAVWILVTLFCTQIWFS